MLQARHAARTRRVLVHQFPLKPVPVGAPPMRARHQESFTPMRVCLLVLVMLLFCFFAVPGFADDPPAADASSLVTNGDFESDRDADGWPDGWPRSGQNVSWQKENSNQFLRLVSARPGETVLLYRAVNVPANTKALEMSWRWRTTDLKPGKEAWFDARVLLNFKDAAGKKLAPGSAAPYLRKSTNGWQKGGARLPVPPGARSLEFMPALFQVEKGTLDLDGVVIKPTDATAAQTPAKVEDPEPEAPQPAKWPQELRVVGNQVQTKDGKTIWLQGLNVVSLEWSARGEHVLRSSQIAIDTWKSNLIRLPLKEDFWFGKGPGQKDDGAAYRALVDAAVNIAANRGAYVMLDLHRYKAPTDEHVAFWKQVAAKYKNHPAVLFDLFNEPHDISWEVWRDGGFVEGKGTAEASKGFRSPGMQRMVGAVRETGARNLVVVGGLDWAYDLSGIARGFALEDKTGNGIVYATHIYPWKSNWKDKVLVVAEKHPVLIGEVGCDIKKMSFLPDNRQEDPYTWAPDMLGFIQKHKLHWTAFSFHPKATPVMITGWDYAPTPFWGAFVKSALLGGQFGLRKMR